MVAHRIPIQERLEKLSIPEPNSGCLLWISSYFRGGYGAVKLDGRLHAAHRISWSLENGPIPAGMFVCHKCDVREYINPAHLFLGTAADNMADMVSKGRNARVLSPKIAMEIFESTESGNALGRKHGVSRQTISMIKLKRIWKGMHK